MATEVLMPQMGESIAEGTITRWLVKVGETVERDQLLFEVSTDKVDAEIPSIASGTLIAIHHQDGETVEVNEVIGLIGAPGEATGTAADDAAPAAAGDTVSEDAVSEDAVSEESAASEESEAGADITEDGPITLEARLRRHSSPVVRKIALEHEIDLTQVEGTGVQGRVTKKDILAYIASPPASREPEIPAPTPQAPVARAVPSAPARQVAPAANVPAASQPAPASAPAAPAKPVATPAASATRPAGSFSVPAYQPNERVEIEPMSRIRQITAAHMTYSKATSAHVTTVFETDMSRIDRIRKQAKNAFLRENGTKLTFMPFIFRAVASALKRFPQLNAAIDGTNIVYKKDINLGMAVAMDRGLIVPVIKNADTLSLIGLARTANDLADRARTKRMKPDEAQGGTFTVTNPGVFGSLFGTPIINQPQVAILSIGTIKKRPVVITDELGNDALAIRTICYLAITFDHRLIDGADADHFMVTIRDTLQEDAWKELEAYR